MCQNSLKNFIYLLQAKMKSGVVKFGPLLYADRLCDDRRQTTDKIIDHTESPFLSRDVTLRQVVRPSVCPLIYRHHIG